MTTEIAIINRLGVALATDSAVTISGGGKTKVWDTADKLFELSSHHPVGIMINGNMDCLGVPWEILIKEFRSTQGHKVRATVFEWMTDFLKFVETDGLIDKNQTEKYIKDIVTNKVRSLQAVVASQINEIVSSLQSLPKKKWPNIKISDLLLKAATEAISELEFTPVADSLEEFKIEDVSLHYNDLFENIICERFPPSEAHKLSDTEKKAIKSLLSKSLVAITASDFATGLVFAGYGSSIFPAVHAVEVDGMVLGKLKYTEIEKETVDNAGYQGRVVSFAQTDVIERLLGGVDPRFVAKTAEFIVEAVAKIGKSVEETLRSSRTTAAQNRKREELIQEIAQLVADEYQNDVAVELRKKFEREFDRMIALMPKQELIELAEALVSITAVERKASADEGTVGGPIDVAMITKHEGFVWIKRKHYFDKDLNPRYLWRISRQSGIGVQP